MNYFESQGFRQDRAHFMAVLERMTKAMEKIAEHLEVTVVEELVFDSGQEKGSGYDDAG
jgi:hypothetical protein